jgi:N-acetylmuramoyl-L-alanine amidase
MRTNTDYIVVHCAATPPQMDIGKLEIEQWHKAKGFLSIGYHLVIRRDGTVEKGRGINEIGAHVVGYNHKSVGVCLVGGMDRTNTTPEDNFTSEQWAALYLVLKELHEQFPAAVIVGHRDLNPGKACPSFDVSQYVDDKPEFAPIV